MLGAHTSVWIATANVKGLLVEDGRARPGQRRSARTRTYVSIVALLDGLAARGVELRLLHAELPSRAFREELAAHPRLVGGALELARCPRVHMKAVIVDGALRCICPSVGQAPADINAPADGIGSAFRITFHLFNDDTARGGAMQLVSRGCGNPGAGDNACFAQRDDLPAVDSTTAVIATVGLVRALPVAPKAALTAGGAVDATVGGLQIGNGAGTADMAIQAGRTVTASAASRVRGPAGSGASEPESIGEAEARGLVVQNAKDDTGALWTNGLLSVQGVAEQRWFRALFVLDRQSYQRQPATVRLNCAAGCNSAAIANALLLNPRNPIWAEGNVDLDGANPLGTAADPMMLIVNGNLTISGNAALSGFVHANQINWSAAAATWDGAIVTSGDFTATTVASIRYDKAMLDTIRLRYGSFVRAPGGWNLY